MCISAKVQTVASTAGPSASTGPNSEEAMAKKCGWFTVRYHNEKKTRFVFVDSSQYGLVYNNVAFFFGLHLYYAYAFYTIIYQRLWYGWIFTYWYGWFSGMGTTVGAHRLWSHRAYKARLPLRILLAMLQTMAGQVSEPTMDGLQRALDKAIKMLPNNHISTWLGLANDLFTWVRDHRLHHKFTETDADPHNSRRGAFFAHVGWLLTKKHPDVHLKGKTIDNSDISNDPVVYYQKKYYLPLYLFFRLLLPIWIPMYFWGETLNHSIILLFGQYFNTLHTTWFVNSAAHLFGDRPYNNKIQPRENFWVSVTSLGEGFHNFHHCFPWDYGIAEIGWTLWDPAKRFIELMSFAGQAYDLKKASNKLVDATKAKYKGVNSTVDWYVNDHPYDVPHEYN